MSDRLRDVDPEVFAAIERDFARQQENVILIASENTVSRAVLEALGSVMTNKYAEGYPGKRYYGGCEWVDVAENLAIARAKALFGADHVNVQPHSGTQANIAVLVTALEPGDTILSMDLAHGGHLSHGHPKNFSGLTYRIVPYGVDPETERIDLDRLRDVALRERPKLIISGASAYSRTIDFAAFGEIAREVDAVHMADIAHIAGLVAAKIHGDPVPHSDFVTTTTHKTLRGPRGGMVLCREEWAKKLDSRLFPGTQGGPLMHVIAAKAVAFKEALSEGFGDYQRQIVSNAKRLADGVAARGFRIVSGGTDNHLFLVDLRPKRLTGKVAEQALERAGIIVNKNMIPFDPEKPTVASGIRVGTPTVTSRGMKEAEMDRLADWMDRALAAPEDEVALEAIRGEVRDLCAAFPLATSYLD